MTSVLSSLIPGFPVSNIQERALDWLEDDPSALAALSSSSEWPPRLLIYRFALVVLYYATTNNSGGGWQNEDLWLSERSACQWYGILCDNSGEVLRLDIGKYADRIVAFWSCIQCTSCRQVRFTLTLTVVLLCCCHPS
jgi:hypothetical protein